MRWSPPAGLINDGIVAGVGAVLGFVPQMLVLFLLLAFLEACGYMARIAFVLDRIFRKFGLSGKSFIPMLIGTGCGIPGIMASRTIENERDRKMTIMTTTFIPCGAKVPFISMVAGAIFGGSAWDPESFRGKSKISRKPDNDCGEQDDRACFLNKGPPAFPHGPEHIAHRGHMVSRKLHDERSRFAGKHLCLL